MYVGIDIGASNTKIVIQKNSEIVKLPQFKTPHSASEFLSSVRSTLSQYLDCYRLCGISVAVPGQIDTNINSIIGVPNINWLSDCILEQLKSLFNCNIRIINDAKAGAIYESLNGALINVKQGLYISCGTGLGGCAIIDSKPHLGQSGCAGEFGHMVIQANGVTCSCGRKGCWEAYSSSKSILQKYQHFTSGCATLSSFAKKLESNDPLCKTLFEEYMTYFEIGLSNLVYLYNPSVICFAGGTVEILPCILPYLESITQSKIIYQNIKFCKALGDSYACAVGALYNMINSDF